MVPIRPGSSCGHAGANAASRGAPAMEISRSTHALPGIVPNRIELPNFSSLRGLSRFADRELDAADGPALTLMLLKSASPVLEMVAGPTENPLSVNPPRIALSLEFQNTILLQI